MGYARDAVPHEVHSMRDIIERIDALYRDDMRLIMSKIVVREQRRFYGLEIRSFFEFDIHHAAMNTRS